MEKNLTTGSVFKNLVLFSLPYLLSYFLQTLYGMADLFIIGQFEGVASTTAVSVGSQVMHMLTVMIVGLAMGTTVSIAQNIGAGDRRKAAQAVGNTVVLFVSVSVALTVLLLLLVRHIVSVMSTPAEAVEGTVAYLTVCFIGIPFITAYNIISSIFRGMGDSRSPMYFIAIACVTNIALDYVFMGALHLGPVGAALGTTVSQAASVAISLFVIRRRHSIPLEKKDFKPEKSVIGKILKIGVPIAAQDGLIQVAFIIITIIANRRGLNDAAAVGIVEKFISFIFLVPSSMLSTVSALGAQNIGADKPERARLTLRYAILLAAGFGLIVSVLIQFSAEPIVALFTDKEVAGGAEVIRLGGQYLRGYIWDCLFAGIHFSFSGYFCACGKSGLSFLHNIIAIMFVRVPGVYLTSNLFPTTLFPMGLATATGSFLSVVICVIAFAVITKNRDENQHSGWGGKRKF
ncbi:MAG: MATE family efflux transporter [Lachnospiraceae bacterium]|nr:MATE family efflux transporter [Lachnospiraceae bacterium]